jgi:DNA-binding YbaB/EbfC family protein
MAKGFNRGMGMPGGMGGGAGGGGMMSQFKKLQEQMEAAQSRLTEMTVTSSVGGGTVQVVMTGDQHCKSVTIDPEMLKDADAEMLQDLILSAVNQALDKSRDLTSQEMGPLASGLPF